MSSEKVGEASTSKDAGDDLPAYDGSRQSGRPPSLAPSYRSVWSLQSLRPRSIAPSYHTLDQREPSDKERARLNVIHEEDSLATSGLARTLSSALNFRERRRQHRSLEVALEAATERQSNLLKAIDKHLDVYLKSLLDEGQDPNEPLYSGRAIPSLSKKKKTGKEALPVFLDFGPAKGQRGQGGRPVVYTGDRDIAGDPPLYRAVFKGNLRAVSLLLEYGADIHGRDYLGETAMTRVTRDGDVEIAKLLLAAGVDVNEPENFDGTTLLMNASICRQAPMVKVLLEAGADVNAQDSGGRTALMNAASSDCPDIVKLLLDSGADPDAVTTEGHTALDQAVLLIFARGLERNGVSDLLIAMRDGRPIEEVRKQPVKIDALSGYSKRQFTNMDIEFSVTSDGMEKHAA